MTEHLLDRIDELERRVRGLDAELRELRRLAAVTAPAPTPPPRVTTPPPAPVPPRRSIPVQPPPLEPLAQEPTIWGRDVGAELRAAFARLDRDVSAADLLGPQALAWTGGIVTVLGVVFFFVLAVNRGWIGPELRVGFGAAASAAVLAAGLWLRRRFGDTYSSLAAVGAGIAGGYATLLAATALYHLVPRPLALAAAGAIAAVAVAISLRWRAQLAAALGLIGAMVVPALVAFDGGLSRVGTAFVAIVLAATGVVGVWMRWRALLVAGAAASVPQIAVLLAQEDGVHWSTVALAAAFWALYAGIGVAEQITRDTGAIDPLPGAFVLGSAGFLVYAAAVLFGEGAAGTDQGVAYLVAAIVYAATAALTRRGVRLLLGALALAAVAVGAADLLSGPSLAYAWAAEAAVLAWAAQRFKLVRFQLAAVVYALLAAGHALVRDATPDHLFRALAQPGEGAPAVAACAVALFVFACTARLERTGDDEPEAGLLRPLAAALNILRAHQPIVRGAAFTLAALLAVYAGSLVVLAGFQAWGVDVERSFELGHVALTAAWAALGLLGFVGAVARRNAPAFVIATGWLACVVAKTATFDSFELDHTLRSYAFFAVAGALLAATILLHELNDALEGIHPLTFPALVATLALSTVGGRQVATGSTADGFAVAAVGLAFALLGAFEQRLPRLRDFATVLWSGGLVVAGVGAAMIVGGIPLVFVWAASAVALGALARIAREPRLHAVVGLYLAAAAAYCLVREAPPTRLVHASEHPGTGLAALAFVVVATAAVALLIEGDQRWALEVRRRLSWSSAILGVYGLCLAILELAERVAPGTDVHLNFQRGHTAVSAFLGILGVGLLYAGLRRGSRALRVGGLSLLALIVAKIFLYDLAALSSAARAVSFLAVGGVLLLGGFFYQRLSANGA